MMTDSVQKRRTAGGGPSYWRPVPHCERRITVGPFDPCGTEPFRRLREFFRALHMPAALEELGGKAEDIPAMVAHRAEKPNGFPFGGFVKIHEADMEAILRRCGA